jgi:hypothetical protein
MVFALVKHRRAVLAAPTVSTQYTPLQGNSIRQPALMPVASG